jgi:rhodanese-related sulfurtransferase
MDPKQAESQIGSAQFVDVREAYEFQAGHIEGSVHIPLLDLPERFAELDRAVPVIAVCQIGQRSELAARFLQAAGYDAHNLEGGMARWSAEGLPYSAAGGEGQVVDGWSRTPDWG